MTEPDVALTDYALALECALLVWLLLRRQGRPSALGAWLELFFGSVGLAALLGGTVHGFYVRPGGGAHAVLWRGTLLAIGGTALAAWMVGARIVASRALTRFVGLVAWTLLAAYAGVVLFVAQGFAIAIANYAPAALFLLAAFSLDYARRPSPRALLGPAGMSLAFIASGLQQARVAIHPIYFNHNALYHLVQGVALWLVYLAGRRLIKREETHDRRDEAAGEAVGDVRGSADRPPGAGRGGGPAGGQGLGEVGQ